MNGALRRHLPRLAPEFYCGRAFVHWTLTTEGRAKGWLTKSFLRQWQGVLLHACARFDLACPVYVLMPDHMHLVWVGLCDDRCDQRQAIVFLRRHLAAQLAPAQWQHQPYDRVLRENEIAQDAFPKVARYILENPVRGGFVSSWQAHSFHGCCIAGYPEMDVKCDDYWERFWRCYNFLVRERAR